MTKDQVRELAASRGLRTAAKPDSQDVCFITRAEGRAAFLSARAELHPGTVVDGSGAQVGRVDAVELVTIGQRRGLDLAGGSERRFVTDVDVAGRTVTVGAADQLRDPGLVVEQLVWADGPVEGAVDAQCSAHGAPAAAVAALRDDGAVVLQWREPQRRVAAGQSVVLYQQVADVAGASGAVVVGGGIVTRG
jgi:tRNA-specific 2-thiouridylase